MYDNTKQKVVAQLGTCHVLIHQEALLDVINVLMALMKDTGLLAKAPAAPTAVPGGGRVSRTVRIAKKLSETKRRLPVWFTVEQTTSVTVIIFMRDRMNK